MQNSVSRVGKKKFHDELRESNLQQEQREDSVLAGTVQNSQNNIPSAE